MLNLSFLPLKKVWNQSNENANGTPGYKEVELYRESGLATHCVNNKCALKILYSFPYLIKSSVMTVIEFYYEVKFNRLLNPNEHPQRNVFLISCNCLIEICQNWAHFYKQTIFGYE